VISAAKTIWRSLTTILAFEHASHRASDAWRSRGIAADGSRRMAPGMVKAHELALAPSGLVNVTDHDSRVVRTHGQPPLQGYNAQMVVNDRQIVLAAEITTDSPDFGHLEPMVRATQRELRAVELDDPEIVLATPATGINARCNTSPARASRCSFRPTAGCARARGRDGPAASTTPCAASSRHPRPRALPPAPDHDRAGVRTDQLQPRDQTLPTSWPNRRPQRMATATTHNILKLHRHRLAATTPQTTGRPGGLPCRETWSRFGGTQPAR
jgi:hypothetical protein